MTTQYTPFVTDFGGTPSSEPFNVFSTDFPQTIHPSATAVAEPVSAPVAAASGLDWSAVAIGGAMGIAFALLVLLAVVVLRARLRGSAQRAAA